MYSPVPKFFGSEMRAEEDRSQPEIHDFGVFFDRCSSGSCGLISRPASDSLLIGDPKFRKSQNFSDSDKYKYRIGKKWEISKYLGHQ